MANETTAKGLIAWDIQRQRPVVALRYSGGQWANIAGDLLADQTSLRELTAEEKKLYKYKGNGTIVWTSPNKPHHPFPWNLLLVVIMWGIVLIHLLLKLS